MVFEEVYDEVLLNNKKFGDSKRNPIKERYSPTDMGGCKRKIVFGFFNAPEDDVEVTGKDQRILHFGNVIHDDLQKTLKLSGREIKSEHYFKVPLDADNQDIIFSGFCDSLMFHDKLGIIALEYKSINTFALKYVPEKGKEEHISQLNMYLHYFKIQKGLLIYYDKNNSEFVEKKINYDPELAQRDIDFVIDTQRNYIDKLEVPEMGADMKKKDYPCSYCKFKEICYGGKDWKSDYYNKLVEEKQKLIEEAKVNEEVIDKVGDWSDKELKVESDSPDVIEFMKDDFKETGDVKIEKTIVVTESKREEVDLFADLDLEDIDDIDDEIELNIKF